MSRENLTQAEADIQAVTLADKWHRDQNPAVWTAGLGSALGEVCAAVLYGKDVEALRAEAVHVAAMATAFVESIDRGGRVERPQHAGTMYELMRRDLTEFEVTENHLKLLRNANIDWHRVGGGSPGLDLKRPYGASNVYQSMAEIIRPDLDNHGEYGDYAETHADELERLHAEVGLALEIVLRVGEFRAGRYRQDRYCSNWQRVDDASGGEPK